MIPIQLTIGAGLGAIQKTPGLVLSVKSCTLPITAAFDGGNALPIGAGTALPIAGGFKFINFFNPNTVAVTLSGFIGERAVEFQPQDNSQSNSGHYAFGNLGIAFGASASGGLPACDSSGFLQVTSGMNLSVPGTNNGHRRQIITFSVSAASASNLQILDANGFAFMTILPGNDRAFVTDSAFKISGASGTAAVTIGEIYLNA